MLSIPPPVSLDVFPVKMQFVSVGAEDWALNIPPPLPKSLEFLVKVQLVSMGEEEMLYIPPPGLSAMFWLKVQSVSVGEDESLYIPPPAAFISNAEFAANVQ
jgi:hypothetical protein